MMLTLLRSKMFDVGTLLVLTFGNCVLKTDLQNYKYTFTFFFKFQKHHFLGIFQLLHTFSRTLYYATNPDASSDVGRFCLFLSPRLAITHNLLFLQQFLQPVVGRRRLLGLAFQHRRLVHLLSLQPRDFSQVLTILHRHPSTHTPARLRTFEAALYKFAHYITLHYTLV